MALPTLDLLAHNLVALCVAMAALMLLAQLVSAALLRASNRLLRFSVFKDVPEEERAAFHKRVRRKTLVGVGLIGLALLAGSLLASFAGLRVLELVRAEFARIRGEELATLRARLLTAVGIVIGGLIINSVARALAGALGKGLSLSKQLAARRELLADVTVRLRTALRTVILCGTAVLATNALELSAGAQRAVVLGSYVFGALHVSRLVVRVAHLLVELLFDMSGMLARLDGPLKHLGSLTHLAGITKRAIDYFVYVGAATWVADAFTPDTWLSRTGRVGIAIIAIFYTSRVLVEVCVLFIREIFLGKTDDANDAGLQRRHTLVPVAVGLLRYGIYFSALVMVLREASIDPTPLLAGAGVLGVAVGLGAQAFVGDIVAGFFILFENLLLVGDLVEVSSVKGRVEEIGVRITKIRDDSGVLHAIPNGEVRKVASHSKAYVNALVDVHVPYEEDLRRVRALLLKIVERALEEETGARERVEVKVQQLGETSILLRVSARVPPGKDEEVADLLRARVVDELRDAGIGAPRSRQAVLIDSGVRVGAPRNAVKADDADKGPPRLFQPPTAD